MEAPDKIYAGYRFKNNYEDLYARKTQLTNRDTEYIRKDALLEWAKEKAELYKKTANIRRSFEMMIRKIESL